MKKLLTILILLLCIFTLPVKAYTKEDIVNLASSIKPCDSRTKALVGGLKSSYERILAERDVTQKNLDTIYNNIMQVKNYAEKNGYCKVDQKDSVSEEAKNYFLNLYYATNDLLLSSPKISDGKVPKTNVVIDPNKGQLDIYENGSISEKINMNDKLNDVGLNHGFIMLYGEIIFFLVAFIVIAVVLKKRKLRSNFFVSLIYVNTFLFIVFTLFRNEISLGMDLVDKMSIEKNSTVKEVVVKEHKILSYPSFGSKYAKVKIFDDSADLYFGDSSDVLSKGLGQSSLYKFPGEGKTVISGHNTGLFKHLFNIKEDDEVTIETLYGRFTYKVDITEIVDYKNVSVLEKDYDLIIYTCYPEINIYGNQRLVVFLKLTNSSWVGDNSEN